MTIINPNDIEATSQATAGHRDAAYDQRAGHIHLKHLDRQWWNYQHAAYIEAYETTWQRLEAA